MDRVVLARFPQAQCHAFADAGHYVLEDQREVLVPMITQFIMSK